MSVLTLRGQEIDWAHAPAPTTRVMWSRRDQYGRQVTGSLRTIAHLDHLNDLSNKKYGVDIIVLQPPYNEGVAASEGTHDFDACLDVKIPGVSWAEQQRFFRANGAGAYARSVPTFSSEHIHYFTLPPREGTDVADDFKAGGFKVGLYVDGGISQFGRKIASAQIDDYYGHKTALAGHAYDPSWFPPNITATIFNLNAYIVRKRNADLKAIKGEDVLLNINTHGPLARLGGDAGADLWRDWEASVRREGNDAVRARRTVVVNADTNKHGVLPNFGGAFKMIAKKTRRIGGDGIDLIGVRRAVGGARVKVLKRKVVDLRIDGHDCHGVKIKVTFPSGVSVTYWNVTANLGRKVSDEVFRDSCTRILKAFGKGAVYNFQEIDEADEPNEHKIVRDVFTAEEFQSMGWPTMCPTLVGRKSLRVAGGEVKVASPGMAKVSPQRVVVKTLLAPK